MIRIYTDGSCLDQGNRYSFKNSSGLSGGWGFVAFDGDKELCRYSGTEFGTDVTNNRMEILAIISALRWAYKHDKNKEVSIITDSMYCKSCINDYMEGWKEAGWRKKRGAIANLDLWKIIDKAKGHVDFTVKWVKGHNEDIGNEIADHLATNAAKCKA